MGKVDGPASRGHQTEPSLEAKWAVPSYPMCHARGHRQECGIAQGCAGGRARARKRGVVKEQGARAPWPWSSKRVQSQKRDHLGERCITLGQEQQANSVKEG